MVLKRAELLPEGLKLIYSGFFNGTFDQDNVNKFSDRHNDEVIETCDYDLYILESEESAEQRRNQEQQGLKILLAPDQMLSNLHTFLAKFKKYQKWDKTVTRFFASLKKLTLKVVRQMNLIDLD